MKKVSVTVIAVTLAALCLLAGCNGAEGGKITDNMQNPDEAVTEAVSKADDRMTEIKSKADEMLTDISEFFTNPEGNITDNAQNTSPATNTADTNTDNVTV